MKIQATINVELDSETINELDEKTQLLILDGAKQHCEQLKETYLWLKRDFTPDENNLVKSNAPLSAKNAFDVENKSYLKEAINARKAHTESLDQYNTILEALSHSKYGNIQGQALDIQISNVTELLKGITSWNIDELHNALYSFTFDAPTDDLPELFLPMASYGVGNINEIKAKIASELIKNDLLVEDSPPHLSNKGQRMLERLDESQDISNVQSWLIERANGEETDLPSEHEWVLNHINETYNPLKMAKYRIPIETAHNL